MGVSFSGMDLLENFKNVFGCLKAEPIVLYGLGENTKLLLDSLPEFNFVGLMDKNSIGCTVYSLPVFSPEEVAKKSKHIILVCNYSSVNIIYQRIAHLKKLGVTIYYVSGEILDIEEFNNGVTTNHITNSENLKLAILSNDVISFDVFDTMITRKVLWPSDIFLITERKAKEELNYTFNFTSKRIEAERMLGKKNFYYNLDDIYTELINTFSLDKELADKIKSMEIETEITWTVPRDELTEASNFAIANGKEVIFTSDMYLDASVIQKIIEKCKLNCHSYKIYVSNNIKKSKHEGDLYEYLKMIYKNKKILHIGDDPFSDIHQAEKHSIETLKITSPVQNIENNKLWDFVLTESDLDTRIILSNFIVTYFNMITSTSPRIIKSTQEIGYFFFGPLILTYVNWLIDMTKKHSIDKILFISRDGYIIEKIYKKINIQKLNSIYFLTSRRTVSVCSIHDKHDIVEVFNIHYAAQNIKLGQFIKVLFGIDISNNDHDVLISTMPKKDLLDHILEHYSDAILENSALEREEYIKYFNTCDIKSNEKIGVVNFVGKGVTQYFLNKLFPGNKFYFYYFATEIDIKQKKLDFNMIHSLYGNYLSQYTSKNVLARHYSMAESVFSAPTEQFVRFRNGIPEYLLPKRFDFSEMIQCHLGIESFFDDILKIDSNVFTRTYDAQTMEYLFGLLFNTKYFIVPDKIKKAFSVTDPYSAIFQKEALW
jgi:predicted HAD superfamily hydrolase